MIPTKALQSRLTEDMFGTRSIQCYVGAWTTETNADRFLLKYCNANINTVFIEKNLKCNYSLWNYKVLWVFMYTCSKSNFPFVCLVSLDGKLGKLCFLNTYHRFFPPIHDNVWYGVPIFKKKEKNCIQRVKIFFYKWMFKSVIDLYLLSKFLYKLTAFNFDGAILIIKWVVM